MKTVIKSFLLFMGFFAVLSILSCNQGPKYSKENPFQAQRVFPEPVRPAGQTDVIELRCAPIDTVRIAIIGLGMRGSEAVRRFTYQEGVKIVALCDLVPENVEKCQKILIEKGWPKADGYTGAEDYKSICERKDIDLIYVCTDWSMHTPIAVYAMEHGKHVATEVPAALTIDECWQLVNTSEKTRKHCMMLENCNYDFFEMATLNMAQQGVFGEIMHVEGAYIHDLRWLNFAKDTLGVNAYYNMWRLKYNETKDGNLYPTHGLGPVCHVLNIHRGDRMTHLVSMSTSQVGMTAYAKEKFGEESDFAKRTYKKGDNNVTLVKTENGKTILIQHDVTSPRPYSRIHMISGTKGFAQKWPVQEIALEPNAHTCLTEHEMDSVLAKYEHPIIKEMGEKAKEVGGHGGMDFIMDYRLIYCLRNGLPLDEDVYDAAEWSAIIELSGISVANESMPVTIPDFTRGAYKKVKKVTYYMK